MDRAGKVLIIDDDAGPRESLRMIIKDIYPVQTASSAPEALNLLSREEFSVILLDLRMPKMDGITALREIKKRYPDIEVLIVTAYASVETAREAIQYGAFDYLMKPFDKNDVIAVVEKGMNKRKKAREFMKEHCELKERCDERDKELMVAEKMRMELFNNASEGIVIMNAEGTVLDLNPRACEMWECSGKDDLVGENIVVTEVGENAGQWNERLPQLFQGKSVLFETEYQTRGGKRLFLEVSAKAIEIEGTKIIQSFYRDITEKKRFQEQIFLTQKMESMGTLAGGLAHDFGNILTTILGHTGLILAEGRDLSEELLRNLEIIESSANYASSIVAQLLSFSRKGETEVSPLIINDVVENTLGIISKILKPDTGIDKNLSPFIRPIMGNAGQLGQVITNLVINARDAMPNGGSIIIKTDMVDIGSNSVDITSPNPLTGKGGYGGASSATDQLVCVTISDTGTGICSEHLQHIFEPFFTTKQKGTGLGLAAVYSTVKDHGGEIKVSSTVGCGTVFTIYFPVVKLQ
jgi:two-component system cell cycle sensor histidine kinase/response regulator CckA